MSMLSWVLNAQTKPEENQMLKDQCPHKKCCKNPSCKMNKVEENQTPTTENK